MKLKNLGVVLLFLLSSQMYSQVSILNGSITSEVDIELEGLNIQNLSRGRGTVTDKNGEFRISASLHDTLSVSAIHIQTLIVIIDDEHISEKRITINLIEKLNELEAVNLRRKSLTGFIGSDARNIPTKDVITASSVGLPNADLPQMPKSQRELYAATDGGLNQLINLISGRTKMIKRVIEMEKKHSLTLQLLNKFPQTFFINALNIKAEEVYSFVFFCEDDEDYNIIMKQTNFEIIQFLERKSIEYRKSLVEEG